MEVLKVHPGRRKSKLKKLLLIILVLVVGFALFEVSPSASLSSPSTAIVTPATGPINNVKIPAVTPLDPSGMSIASVVSGASPACWYGCGGAIARPSDSRSYAT